jgi:uncharacterized protein (DUF1684 family)
MNTKKIFLVRICFLIILIIISFQFRLSAQSENYADSLRLYRENYMLHHDVIKGKDTSFFRFFPADEHYRVTASFKKDNHSSWFKMETSGRIKKIFRVYGTLEFTIHDTLVKLNIYQSQDLMADAQYHDYLFLPFTDITTGAGTYQSGRYLDFTIKDIHHGQLVIDFNRAYNPDCAYISDKYNCPIPPKENILPVAVMAGEKNFGKNVH